MTDPVPTDAPELPPLPETDALVQRFHELLDKLGQIEPLRIELAAIDARLHERGVNPNTYTPGPTDSPTTDHEVTP